MIERAVITARHGRLNLELGLPQPIESEDRRAPQSSIIDRETILTEPQLRKFEKENLVRALQKSQWRVAGNQGAARLLGMPPSTLQSRMKALGIKRPRD
ncbi:MAG TPA: helix-turn-helix domain-containing protein [Desulfobacterales bacterium]